eukprot:CAMPEP_0205911382 /NCGR_PEP_ID=MMETSP1325-20131115/5114_1 /ASSEMBLY_ACC=CAM_ASM_000708 /TAXON_ID=236786 /ORGANISM="Florenciella sp., Strain RCC1007" /LENGTH=89 /DNA_ID=CAMNT_0053277905 /DNA_START=207 /DNA_END=473 /DNA_ORIENTATION=-
MSHGHSHSHSHSHGHGHRTQARSQILPVHILPVHFCVRSLLSSGLLQSTCESDVHLFCSMKASTILGMSRTSSITTLAPLFDDDSGSPL